MTFVVRAMRSSTGRLHGVIERVRTGEKERFEGLEGLTAAFSRMLADDAAPWPAWVEPEDTHGGSTV